MPQETPARSEAPLRLEHKCSWCGAFRVGGVYVRGHVPEGTHEVHYNITDGLCPPCTDLVNEEIARS
jgi:hypothetical protein